MKLEFKLPQGWRWLRRGERKNPGDLFPDIRFDKEEWKPVFCLAGLVESKHWYIRRKTSVAAHRPQEGK